MAAKHERQHDAPSTPSAIHGAQIVLGNLAVFCPSHDLPGSLDNMTEAPGAANRLATRELPSIGVDRKSTFVRRICGVEEISDLAFLAEACILEANGLQNRVSVIEFGKLHILRPVARHLEGPGSRKYYRCDGDVRLLGDRVVGCSSTPRSEYVDWRIGQGTGPLR